MDHLSPSDSISQAGSHNANIFYEPPPYGTPTYHQRDLPPLIYMHGLPYNSSYGAQAYASANQAYRNPNSQNAGSQSHTQTFSRGHLQNRRHSSFASSSTVPGNLGSRYVPTLSYADTGSTPVVSSNVPYPEQYSSGIRTHAASAHYSAYQSQLLQVPESVGPASSYRAHRAPAYPTASPCPMEVEAHPQYSLHSTHSSRSQHSRDLHQGHSSHSLNSHLVAGSRQSVHSHSYQPRHASPSSSRPLVPRHAQSVSSHSHRPSHTRSYSHQSPQAAPTPGPSSEAVVLLQNVAIRVTSSAPGPGPLVVINIPQQYSQQTEKRKLSLFGNFTNLLGRNFKSKGRRRRDSY